MKMNFTYELSTSPNLGNNATFYFDILYIRCLAYTINAILGLPMNFYVLWRICTGAGNGIVAEFFMLNLTVCEILFCLVSVVFAFAHKCLAVAYITSFSVSLPYIGRPLINCVICIERYVAVLHPVIFLKYKPLRYRLVCSAVIWVIVLGFGVFCLFALSFNNMYMFICLYLPLFSVFLLIKSFCCLNIVRALNYPGPGEKGKERDEGNHMKKKAVVVILIITVTMFLQYMPVICLGLLYTHLLNAEWLLPIGFAIFIIFSYVSPILYICRVKKRQIP